MAQIGIDRRIFDTTSEIGSRKGGIQVHRWLRGAALIMLAIAVAGCGGAATTGTTGTTGGSSASGTASSPTTYGPAQTIVQVGDITDPVTMDPGSAYETTSVGADILTYATLVHYPTGDLTNVKPWLASSWDTSADGRTWTFHLAPNMKFSSGDPVTAADVVYTLERVVNLPNDPASWLITQMGITPQNVDQVVKATDPSTVTISLPQAFSPGAFLAIFANTITGVVDSKVVKAHVQSGDWGAKWLYNHSAGAGPYVLTNWTKDEKVEFTVNPNYTAGPAPAIKHIIWNNVTDNTAQLDQLQRGDADIATGLSPDQIASLSSSSTLKVFKAPEIAMEYLGMDVGNVPAFQKPQVLQAVRWAIDYKSITTNLLKGNATPLEGIVPKGIFGYTANEPFTFDPAKAKQLLAAAGYPNGFSVTLTVPSGQVAGGIAASDLATALQGDLGQAGIKVQIQQLAGSELLSQYRAHKLQMVLAGWFMDYPDPQDFGGPFGDYTQKSLIWRLQDNDQQLAKLAQQAAALPNGAQRQSLYDQMNQLEWQSGPFAIMYQPVTALGYSAKLQNLVWDPANMIDYAQITKGS
jgi:peptide/nickel transport system substrate-binding protein